MKRKGNLTSPDVLQRILRWIENGKFRPGDRLIPAVIARELGGSTIPVREALCQLTGRDILVEQRNKGFTVAPMTSATLRSFYTMHGQIMEKVLQFKPDNIAYSGRSRNRWRIFAAITESTRQPSLIGVQRYLAGRLALVRQYEEAYFDAKAMHWEFVESFRVGDLAAACEVSAGFHRACENSASEIWQMATDR